MRDSPCEERLTRPGGAIEEHPLGLCDAEAVEQLRVLRWAGSRRGGGGRGGGGGVDKGVFVFIFWVR
jgi:hypothetical protein